MSASAPSVLSTAYSPVPRIPLWFVQSPCPWLGPLPAAVFLGFLLYALFGGGDAGGGGGGGNPSVFFVYVLFLGAGDVFGEVVFAAGFFMEDVEEGDARATSACASEVFLDRKGEGDREVGAFLLAGD